jgi:hypothetical protein
MKKIFQTIFIIFTFQALYSNAGYYNKEEYSIDLWENHPTEIQESCHRITNALVFAPGKIGDIYSYYPEELIDVVRILEYENSMDVFADIIKKCQNPHAILYVLMGVKEKNQKIFTLLAASYKTHNTIVLTIGVGPFIAKKKRFASMVEEIENGVVSLDERIWDDL